MVAVMALAGGLTGCDVTPALVTGTVTTTVGSNAGGVTVELFADNAETLITQTTTNGFGMYQVQRSAVADGTYRLRIDGQWWPAASSWATATPLGLSGAAPTTANMVLVEKASLSGTLVAGASPAAGILVLARDSSGVVVASTATAADGTFALGVLDPAALTVGLVDPGLGVLIAVGGPTATTFTPGLGDHLDVGSIEVTTGLPTSPGTPLGTVDVYADSPSNPGALVVMPDDSVWFANLGNGTLGRRSADGEITTFPSPEVKRPSALAVGPDGQVWFTDQLTNRIGRVSAAGDISTFPSGLPEGALGPSANDITTGPDGNLWYVGLSGSIAKRTPAGVVTVYPGSDILPGYPQRITSGPDGNLWYTTAKEQRFGTGNRTIVRITTEGVATAFTTADLIPGDITAGPDGNLWFTNNDSIGRITTTGAITLFYDPAISLPTDITAGPDGNLWFVGRDQAVGRITTAGVATRFADPTIVAAGGIAATSDGLWFTNPTSNGSGAIDYLSTTGTFTLASPGANLPIEITKGSDGSVWFANFFGEDTGYTGIGRIAPDGTTQVFHSTGVRFPRGLAPGTDGSAWFTNEPVDTIGRVSPSGAFTYFTDPAVQAPRGITLGSDGSMWFTNHDSSSIGRITPGGTVTAYPTGGGLKPDDITSASDGGMWFDNDGSATVGRIDPAGAIVTFVLPHPPTAISAVGPDLWFTVTSENLIGKITPNGVVTTYTDPLIDSPGVLAGDAAGNIYFGNGNTYYSNGFGTGRSIGRRTPGGVVTLYPSNTIPQDLVGGSGDIWFTNGLANSVTRFGTG
ncbi:MAG: hypothetical protein ABIP03_15655 [Aquihabitans sp.]